MGQRKDSTANRLQLYTPLDQILDIRLQREYRTVLSNAGLSIVDVDVRRSEKEIPGSQRQLSMAAKTLLRKERHHVATSLMYSFCLTASCLIGHSFLSGTVSSCC